MNNDGEDVREWVCAECLDRPAIQDERLCIECKKARGDDDEDEPEEDA